MVLKINNKEACVMGIDIGGTGCKVTLFNRQGYPVASSYKDYPLLFPRPGWVEANPETWWGTCVENMRQVMNAKPDIMVAAISISCTNSLVTVDAKGEPFGNAIMQLDQRSAPMVEVIKERISEERVGQITGNRVASGTYVLPTILWLKQNRPEIINRPHTFLAPTGFIVRRLTGLNTIDYTRAATTMLFDINQEQWSLEIMAATGVNRSELPDIYAPWEIVGGVTKEAAALTGVPADTPVVAGCMDTVAAMLGAGLGGEGEVLLTLGTVGRLSASLDKKIFDRRFLNCHHGIKDRWISIALVNTVGAALKWYQRTIVDRDGNTDSLEYLNELADRVPAGSEGLIFLPYLAGERSPLWDPAARGILFGLTLRHSKGHIFRAILEGIGYALRSNLEILEKQIHRQITRINLAGGGARSKIWIQTLANILQRPLVTLKDPNTEPLGAAWLAGTAVGAFDFSLGDIIQRQEDQVIIPTSEGQKTYEDLYKIFVELYDNCARTFGYLSRVVNCDRQM